METLEITRVLGQTLTFKVPSGFEVTIREQNGDDDDIMSKTQNTNDGSAINKLVASVILSTSLGTNRLSDKDIIKWKNKDKYYVVLKSRILSLGSELVFKHKCVNSACGKETTYEEDLSQYDRDFSKPLEETNNGFKYQITPYIDGNKDIREFSISSGVRLKYEYLNGLSEKKLLDIPKDELSKNTELTIRNLAFDRGQGNWMKIENFKMFTSKQMSEIRKDIKEHDMPFEALSEITCPICKNKTLVSLMSSSDFFYPLETL